MKVLTGIQCRLRMACVQCQSSTKEHLVQMQIKWNEIKALLKSGFYRFHHSGLISERFVYRMVRWGRSKQKVLTMDLPDTDLDKSVGCLQLRTEFLARKTCSPILQMWPCKLVSLDWAQVPYYAQVFQNPRLRRISCHWSRIICIWDPLLKARWSADLVVLTVHL